MTRVMKTAIKGHEQIFSNSDEYFIDIAWNDIPEFCEVMENVVDFDFDFEIIKSVKYLHHFLETYRDTISTDLFYKADAELDAYMETLTVIAKRNLF